MGGAILYERLQVLSEREERAEHSHQYFSPFLAQGKRDQMPQLLLCDSPTLRV